MGLAPGTHSVGPGSGSCRVQTYREGVAQKVGHDLIIEVSQWEANAEVDQNGRLTAVSLQADPRSLQVLEGHRGVKPLTDSDRAEIRSNIDEKVLRGESISFRSSEVELTDERITVRGELTMAGTTRPATFELHLDDHGHVQGTLQVTQSEWGIKPYRAFMGALKVRDTVEVVLDADLPTA
jgi:polyisoprenoid-binding protein YceI